MQVLPTSHRGSPPASCVMAMLGLLPLGLMAAVGAGAARRSRPTETGRSASSAASLER